VVNTLVRTIFRPLSRGARAAHPPAQEQVTDQRSRGVEDDVVDVEGPPGDQGTLRELHQQHHHGRQQQHPQQPPRARGHERNQYAERYAQQQVAADLLHGVPQRRLVQVGPQRAAGTHVGVGQRLGGGGGVQRQPGQHHRERHHEDERAHRHQQAQRKGERAPFAPVGVLGLGGTGAQQRTGP
jgi:hypothetical protein